MGAGWQVWGERKRLELPPDLRAGGREETKSHIIYPGIILKKDLAESKAFIKYRALYQYTQYTVKL